eukprot:225821-Hanusia_phi.AAC.1
MAAEPRRSWRKSVCWRCRIFSARQGDAIQGQDVQPTYSAPLLATTSLSWRRGEGGAALARR